MPKNKFKIVSIYELPIVVINNELFSFINLLQQDDNPNNNQAIITTLNSIYTKIEKIITFFQEQKLKSINITATEFNKLDSLLRNMVTVSDILKTTSLNYEEVKLLGYVVDLNKLLTTKCRINNEPIDRSEKLIDVLLRLGKALAILEKINEKIKVNKQVVTLTKNLDTYKRAVCLEQAYAQLAYSAVLKRNIRQAKKYTSLAEYYLEQVKRLSNNPVIGGATLADAYIELANYLYKIPSYHLALDWCQHADEINSELLTNLSQITVNPEFLLTTQRALENAKFRRKKLQILYQNKH